METLKVIDGDGPEYGDGDGGGGDIEQVCCENCGGGEFALWYWYEKPVVICTLCQKPQEFVTHMEVDD